MSIIRDEEFLMIGFLVLVIALGIAIPYLLTLQRTLEAVSPENRRMQPGMVWLLLVPLFGYVWSFMVVTAIADSLDLEYRKRNIPRDPRPTYTLGITMAVLSVCGGVLIYIPFLNLIGLLIGLVNLVLWIIYWVQVAEHKNTLRSGAFYYQNQQYGQQYTGYQNPNPQSNQQYNPYNQTYNQQNYPPNYPPYGNQNPPPPQDPNDPGRWGPPGDTNAPPPPGNPNDPNRWGPPGG